MSGNAAFWRPVRDGAQLFVRVSPKASADAVEGIVDAADGASLLKVRLRAAPEKGRANAALEKLLADALDLPRNAVRVTGGLSSRLKTVTVTGDPAHVAQRIGRLAAGPG